MDSLRIDKWLWFTRFFKSRADAAQAVRGGHVKLNGSRVKPAASVRAGDRLDIVRNQVPWVVTVMKLPVRRGPASEARDCYEESAESMERRAAKARLLSADRKLLPMTSGRPDRQTRRALIRRRKG